MACLSHASQGLLFPAAVIATRFWGWQRGFHVLPISQVHLILHSSQDDTNSLAYGTRKFSAVFTRSLGPFINYVRVLVEGSSGLAGIVFQLRLEGKKVLG